MVELKFISWQRSGIYSLTTAMSGGRISGQLPITISDRSDPSDTETRTVSFQVLGPPDVKGLDRKAIAKVTPPPSTPDADTDKCPHVEFTAVDLPWRYTPFNAAGSILRPWLVLVVGTESEITITPSGNVVLDQNVLADHNLSDSARWAHVDRTEARVAARILSPRVLLPNLNYIAALIPAFKPDGSDSWGTNPTQSETLGLFYHWKFSTGSGGDFVSLAGELKPQLADPALGRADLDYDRVNPMQILSIRGALAPISGTDAALPASVTSDVQMLRSPLQDERGRPVVTLPIYGASYTKDAETTLWGQSLNNDPRHRTAAGLGVSAGIKLQEIITASATEQSGGVDIASQRIRSLTMGRLAASSLWKRHLPTDPLHRLQIFGPSMRRIVTRDGTVHHQIDKPIHAMPASLFSGAARRILRPGPARTTLTKPGAIHPRLVLESANRCPKVPDRAPQGLPHPDPKGQIEKRMAMAVKTKELAAQALLDYLRKLDLSGFSQQAQRMIKELVKRLEQQYATTKRLPYTAISQLIDFLTAKKRPDDEEIARIIKTFDDTPDDDSILALIDTLLTEPPYRPCRLIDLDMLSKSLSDAIDPTAENAFMVTRVLGTLSGLDAKPLAPPRFCPRMDLPLWQYLRDEAPDWLLPGVGQLEDNVVVAVTTNPGFIDAFLVGINTQALAELLWRNVAVNSLCTLFRIFWDRINATLNLREDDIIGIADWPTNSELGATNHQAPSESSRDLVVVFKGSLFHRYPETLIYLAPAHPDATGDPDWDQNPQLDQRLYPVFQGKVGEDAVFFGFDIEPNDARDHWVVLEEPPPGFRFRNKPHQSWDNQRINEFNNAPDGARFALAAFHDPTRVLIRGSALIREVNP